MSINLGKFQLFLDKHYAEAKPIYHPLDPLILDRLLGVDYRKYLIQAPGDFQPSENEIRMYTISLVVQYLFKISLGALFIAAMSTFTPISVSWVIGAGVIVGTMRGLKEGLYGNNPTVEDLINRLAKLNPYFSQKGQWLCATIHLAHVIIIQTSLYALCVFTPLSPLVSTGFIFGESHGLAANMTCLAARKIKMYMTQKPAVRV